MSAYWSYLLTAVGVFGLYLAGRKDRRGWMVGIGAQVLWIAYAVTTHQWGFLVSAGAYGWVYAKNARAWKSRPADDRTIPIWRWKIWKRWHNLRCAECRPCYTFWTCRPKPLAERNDPASRSW